MAYGVYYRDKGDRVYARAGEMVTATKGKFKGSLIFKDSRFETLEEAEKKAGYYRNQGCETKIKELK